MWVYQWDEFFNDLTIVTISNSLSKLFFLICLISFKGESFEIVATISYILLTDDAPLYKCSIKVSNDGNMGLKIKKF